MNTVKSLSGTDTLYVEATMSVSEDYVALTVDGVKSSIPGVGPALIDRLSKIGTEFPCQVTTSSNPVMSPVKGVGVVDAQAELPIFKIQIPLTIEQEGLSNRPANEDRPPYLSLMTMAGSVQVIETSVFLTIDGFLNPSDAQKD